MDREKSCDLAAPAEIRGAGASMKERRHWDLSCGFEKDPLDVDRRICPIHVDYRIYPMTVPTHTVCVVLDGDREAAKGEN